MSAQMLSMRQAPMKGKEMSEGERFWQKLAMEHEARLDAMQTMLNELQVKLACADFSTTAQTGQSAEFERRLRAIEGEIIPKKTAEDLMAQNVPLLRGLSARLERDASAIDLLWGRVQKLESTVGANAQTKKSPSGEVLKEQFWGEVWVEQGRQKITPAPCHHGPEFCKVVDGQTKRFTVSRCPFYKARVE